MAKAKPSYRDDLLAGQAEAAPVADEAVETPVVETPEVTPEAVSDTPAPDSPVDAAAEIPTPAPQPSFLDQLSELGFQDIADEDQARTRAIEAIRQQRADLERQQKERSNLETFAEYGRQYIASLQRQPEPAQPPQAEAKPWWNPPQFEPGWIERYRQVNPETQEVEWKKDTPAEVIAKTQAYVQYRDEWVDGLTNRPQDVLPPAIKSVLAADREFLRQLVQPIIEETYQSRRQQETQEQFVARIQQENADWLYEKDPLTNQATRKLTRDGELVMQRLDALEAAGVQDPQQQWDLAMELFNAGRLQTQVGQQQQTLTAQQTAQQMRQQHLQRAAAATSIPSRGGSVPKRETREPRRQNEHQRPGHDLLAQMEEDGVGTT
jgi:hypothetical protein